MMRWFAHTITTTCCCRCCCCTINQVKKKVNVKALQVEFRLLKMLSSVSHHFPQHFPHKYKKLHLCLTCVVSSIQNICQNEGIDLYGENFTEWNSMAEKVKDMIQECKVQIMKYCEDLKWFRIWSCFTLDEYVEYIDVLHCYMNVVVFEEFDEDEFATCTFKTVADILFLLKHLIAFTPRRSGQDLDLDFYVQHWTRKTERLILLSWSWQNKPKGKLRNFHLNVLRHDDPNITGIIRSCFELIEHQKLRHSDSLIFWEFVSRFLVFLLENVDFTFKDDVPVLRDGLKLLITSLADLPTNTMDNADLSYFQQRLDAVFNQASFATIMDLSRGNTAVVHLQEPVHEVKAFLVEFRFLKLLSSRFSDNRLNYDVPLISSLSSIIVTIEDMLKNGREDLHDENSTEWNSEATKLNHKILDCMAEIKNNYVNKHLIQISQRADFFTLEETVRYLDVIHRKMNDLVERRLGEFAPVKIQNKTLEQILFLLRNLIAFTPRSGQETYQKALHLEFYVHHWANMAVSMKLLSWLNEEDNEEPNEKLRALHLDFLQKANPFIPQLIRLCFGLIKIPKLRRLDTIIFWDFVSRFVDFFLENVVFTLEDDVPVLRNGLILLINFLADPPINTMDHSDLSFFEKKIHAVFDQASQVISYFGETGMDFSIGRTAFVHLQESVDEIKGEIERFYVKIAYLSWFNYPRTNGLGHFESLLVYLENLKETMKKNEKIVPLIEHQVYTITDELMSLRLLLHDIWKMQNNHEEVKGMWDEIISLSYQADLAIKSSFFIDHSIWYNLTSLSLIVEKIKYVQIKVVTIKDSHIYGTEVTPPLISSVDVYQAPSSTCIVDVVVGFKHETEELIVRLTRGTKNLDIVPIVGMGGIGKTTLAKKLFNEMSIIRHFHKRAFGRVSQEYKKKNVLLDILSDLCMIDDEVRQMSDDDLALMLKKCLSGCKYLIVLDDIWDIKDWYDMRASFPNDNNGSRVIFTTRISNISLTENSGCNSHLLPFLSVDESWELLQKKIFHKDPCPPHLCDLGKLIAEKCQGLPLAIVLTAGLLIKTERILSHWNEVSNSLTAFVSREGCKDVIRLSYQRLPEPLKSCFLYLGAFREDEKIKAKMLTRLWVAEGFVLKSGGNLCLRKVAKKYLNQLGDTNLVTVTKRSCNGGIKHFHVHDLIRDFCRMEAQQQHYMCFLNSQNSKLSMAGVCNHYRVCVEDEWRSFVDSKPRGPTVHSLLHYSKDYCVAKSLESFLCDFKLVQVLDLQMQVEVDGGFPTAVTTLIHLRYLAIRLHKLGIEKVPSEISNLWNLETLLILGIKVQFPCDIWKMKRLRHVETDDEAHVALDDDVSGLPDLETFISLVIPPGKDGAELLRRLPNIRKLSCLFSGYSWFHIPKLDVLAHLESLQIRYIGEGFSGNPYTFSFPLNIRKLTLESFELQWNEFNAVIRKLPTLEVLVLRWTTSYDDAKIWDVEEEEFPNIRSLTVEDSDIEEWKASTDSFPYMEKLKLSYCKHLREIPSCFGEVPTLKHVVVRYCNKGVEDSALQIQEDSDDQINLEVLTHNINLKDTI